MKATAKLDITFEATSREDALRKAASHLSMLAQCEANGMKVETGASWFEGPVSIDVTDEPAPAANVNAVAPKV